MNIRITLTGRGQRPKPILTGVTMNFGDARPLDEQAMGLAEFYLREDARRGYTAATVEQMDTWQEKPVREIGKLVRFRADKAKQVPGVRTFEESADDVLCARCNEHLDECGCDEPLVQL